MKYRLKYVSLALLLMAAPAFAQDARTFKITNDAANTTGWIKVYTETNQTQMVTKADFGDWGEAGFSFGGVATAVGQDGVVDIALTEACHVFLVPTDIVGTFDYCVCGKDDSNAQAPACRGRLAVEQITIQPNSRP